MTYEISGYTRRPDGNGAGPCEHLGTRPNVLGAVIAAKVIARERGEVVSVTGLGLYVAVGPDGSTSTIPDDGPGWREPRAWQVEISRPHLNDPGQPLEVYGPTLNQALSGAGVATAGGRWRLARLKPSVGKVAEWIALETQANAHDEAARTLAKAMHSGRALSALGDLVQARGSRRYATEEEIELRKHYLSEMLEQLADNHTPAEIEQIRRAF